MLATQTTNTEWWSIGLIVAYFVVLLLTRWLFVARPQQRASEAMLDGLEAEIHALPGPAEGALDAIGRARELRSDQPNWFLRMLSWSGARDIAIWRLGHDAQRLAIAGMSFEQVSARLARARSEVGELPAASQAYWSVALRTAWTPAQDAAARATLNEFLVELFDARDVKFANLATAQTRVVWIASVGLVLILVLTQHEYDVVFAAGAAGAVVARMRSALQQRDVASDYGLSWSSLALTPVAGALSAWVGLFFVSLLQDLEILNLKEQLGTIGADDIRNPKAPLLGLAILFGFAERLLNRVSDELQESVATTRAAPPMVPAAAGAVPAPEPPAPADGASDDAGADEEVDEAEHYGEESPVTGLSLGDVEGVEDAPALEEDDAEEGEDADAPEGEDVPDGEADGEGGDGAPGVSLSDVEAAIDAPELTEEDDDDQDGGPPA